MEVTDAVRAFLYRAAEYYCIFGFVYCSIETWYIS